MDEYDGRQFVGMDLHRQRSVVVRQSESGEWLSAGASTQVDREGRAGSRRLKHSERAPCSRDWASTFTIWKSAGHHRCAAFEFAITNQSSR